MNKNISLLSFSLSRWKQDQLIVLLMILGISSGYFAMGMADGFIQYHLTSSGDGSMYTTVTVYPDPQKTSAQSIAGFLEREPLGAVHNILLFHESEEGPLLIGWKGSVIGRWFPVNTEPFFSESDMADAAKKVYLSTDLLPSGIREYGDASIRIGGDDFGILSTNDLIINNFYHGLPSSEWMDKADRGIEIIPYTAYLRLGLPTALIRIDLKELDCGRAAAIRAAVSQWFEHARIVLPPSYAQANIKRTMYIYFIAGLLCVLSLGSIIALFGYWIETNRKRHMVYALSGASPPRIFRLILLEWAVLSLISYLLAAGLQLALGGALIRFNIAAPMNPARMLTLYASGLLVTAVFLLKPIIGESKAFKSDFTTGGGAI